VRETLAALYKTPVELRLFEPTVPSIQGWRAIIDGARLYRIAGTRSNAALIVRPAAALALASAAFSEPISDARTLSSVESTVLERIIAGLAGNFVTVCGARAETLVAEPVRALDGFLTYFEIVVERPVSASIGIGIARLSGAELQGVLQIDDLLDVEIDVRVRTEGTVVPAGELAALEPGAIVPITVSTGLTAVATVAGRPLARGECGVRNNRVALAIGHSSCTERGSAPES
jgi:flagellar motor switch/type III secretory pathway protein FliN